MHCYADLPSSPAGDDAQGDGGRGWDDQDNPDPTVERDPDPSAEAVGSDWSPEPRGDPAASGTRDAAGAADGVGAGTGTGTGSGTGSDDGLLDPDGIVDNGLTVLVAIAGGVVVGVVGTTELLLMTGSAWALPVGLFAWLGSTAYLSRRRTVQGAVAHTGYAVAAVLVAIPFVAWSPTLEAGSLGDRAGFFAAALVVVALPAAVAGAVGYVASRFVPESAGGR
jgi:hypothetical protein